MRLEVLIASRFSTAYHVRKNFAQLICVVLLLAQILLISSNYANLKQDCVPFARSV
jgi:hypothetical protein